MPKSAERRVVAAGALYWLTSFWALAMTGGVPVAAWVVALAVPPVLVLLAFRGHRVVTWILLALIGISVFTQLLPPIEVWRLGVAVLDVAAGALVLSVLTVRRSEGAHA